MKRKLIALAVGCLIFSCAKDFNNPIDPENESPLPATPQNLKVFSVVNSNKVQGSFEYEYGNASGVIVERRPASGGQFVVMDSLYPSDVAFVDSTGLQDSTEYEYRVCGFNFNGISGYSKVAMVRTGFFMVADRTPPDVRYVSPVVSLYKEAISDSAHLVFKGTITDAGSGIKDFLINGRPVTNSGGLWRFDSTLTAFRNRLYLVASDSNGNIWRDTVTVLVDCQNIVPSLKISRDTLNHKLIVRWTPVTDIDFKQYLLTYTNSLTGGQPMVASDTFLLSANRNADSIVFFPPSPDSVYRFILIVVDSLDNTTNGAILPVVYTPKGMKIIPAGTFQMGDIVYSDEGPVHTVTVSSFCMDSTEVTQADYLALTGVNPSNFIGDLNRPVELMSWYDAILYCNARSKRDGLDTVYTHTVIYGTPFHGCSGTDGLTVDFTKTGYRLPTEAEWEYACRAGSTAQYYWGGGYPPKTGGDTVNLNANCWWYLNSGDTTHPVAQKLPNAFGLYDMSGNIWEWCNDWYNSGYYGASPDGDPHGPETGSYRVLRGGSWLDDEFLNLRSAVRLNNTPDVRDRAFGFRCVCR